MVAVGFSAFEKEYLFDAILSEVKDQTVRKERKQPIKVDDLLHLYWHMRRKDCELISLARCKETFKVYIAPDEYMIYYYFPQRQGNKKYKGFTSSEMEDFWMRDGFEDIDGFWNYFEEDIYDTIRWKLIQKECPEWKTWHNI